MFLTEILIDTSQIGNTSLSPARRTGGDTEASWYQ